MTSPASAVRRQHSDSLMEFPEHTFTWFSSFVRRKNIIFPRQCFYVMKIKHNIHCVSCLCLKCAIETVVETAELFLYIVMHHMQIVPVLCLFRNKTYQTQHVVPSRYWPPWSSPHIPLQGRKDHFSMWHTFWSDSDSRWQFVKVTVTTMASMLKMDYWYQWTLSNKLRKVVIYLKGPVLSNC